jgi:dehydrogenase/reductase SDR family protein 7B
VEVVPIDMADLSEHSGGSLDEYILALRKKLKDHSLNGIDCLIGNAGVSSRGTALNTSEDVLRNLMNVNFFGPVALTKAIAKDMCERKTGGSIAVVSSVQGKLGLPLRSSYTSSKHALQGYFDSLRGELSVHGVDVSVISPGYISTNLSMNAVTETGEKYGVMDETTRNGMAPAVAARMTLLAIAQKTPDLVMADGKTVAAIQGKVQFPELVARLMKSRAKKAMT